MRNQTSFFVAFGLLWLGACGAEQTAPEEPTWEADVYPIVQGQCLHCHGANAWTLGRTRFDFFDLEKCEGFSLPQGRSLGAYGLKGSILQSVTPQTFDDSASYPSYMPPLPAAPMHDWESETFVNWDAIDDKEKARGTRRNNKNPRIRITSKLPDTVGASTRIRYVAEDADGDPVIGWLRLGDSEHFIEGPGAGEANFTNIGGSAGDELELTADLCDGWKRVSVDNLAKIEKR